MKTLNKSLLIVLAFILSYANVIAQQCIYSDDFERSVVAEWEFSPNTITSADGWIWNCVRHRAEDGLNVLSINGSTGARQGYIISPVLRNGSSNIKFSYLSQSAVSVRLDVIQGDTVSWTKSINVVDDHDWHEISEIVSVKDEYQLLITNVSATSGRGTGQYVLKVKDICITTLNGEVPAAAVGIEGITKTEGGFWDKALVTLSAANNSNIYYTLDGTEPVVSPEFLYTAPFQLDATATVKAIAVSNENQSESLDTLINITATAFRFNVPTGATVFVGEKSTNVTVAGNYLVKHYIPFEEKFPIYVDNSGENTVYAYNVAGKHNYRVSRAGDLTHVGVFTPNATNKELTFTNAQLTSHNPKEIDHDVNSLNGRNVSDIFLNINAQGYLNLPLDTTFQIVNLRNWQAIDSDVNNYFIEPDFHYTVVNEQGEPDNSVVSINSTGLLTPVSAGKAIVLVSYDAMMCAHTTNVGNNGAAFFGAIWPENTGIFVVSIDAPASGITTNMTIGEFWNANGTDKVDDILIDAEHDVLYYEASTGGFDYTFKPEGISSVTLAQPEIGPEILAYNGFSTDGVTAHEDRSYTVRLIHGRNIIKLTSSNGASEYQIITAKPVTYTISNVTNPDQVLQPGDEVAVKFNTLYHPSNKLSGIYNMSAGIQYTGFNTDFPLILGPGQYTFASRAQDYKIEILSDYTDEEFVLTHGVIKVRGYGSFYGEHRNITQQNGVAPNLNASVRTAYFGSLPNIYIRMTDKPSTPSNLQAVAELNTIVLSWTASVDNIEVEGYNIYLNGEFYASTTETNYTVESLSGSEEYLFEVEAFDNDGQKSDKASVRQSLLVTGVANAQVSNSKVYPNPFTNFIVVESLNSGNAEISDLSGKALLNISVEAGQNRVNTSMLEKGVYLLKVNGKATKIVK